MGTVLLARHGETTWNRDGRIQGWAPTPLTDRGHDQARALASHLEGRGVDRLVASDLRRTRQTARYLARVVGRDPTLEPAFRERDFGFLQGLTGEDLAADHPEYSIAASGADAVDVRPRSGESVLDVRDRVLERWADLRASVAGTDETAAVVAHGGPLHLLLGHLKGLGVAEAMLDQDQDNCAVTELAVDEAVDVVRENDTDFLP
jgi:probable phosphoglycerate mutase